ncbi:hypothetical protein Taro_018844 [Colocasia esculenta]|uniref:Uncharacterized protein n=1 Tax=Colocasia esculenta TaxID=4460 RepID=A0A843V0B8_COLES|nr:hypothetical protein [Colocasia esculenta]
MEVWDVGACVVRLWSHLVDLVSHELLCLVVCFRLLEFLLLWLVRDWLSLLSRVRKAHPPTLFRVSSVGRLCQPKCTAGSLFGNAAEPSDAI